MDEVTVVDSEGVTGCMQDPSQVQNPSAFQLVILANGDEVRVAGSDLTRQRENLFVFSGSFSQLSAAARSAEAHTDLGTLPLVEEVLHVGTRQVERGVRVRKTVEHRTESVDEPEIYTDVEVKRVPVNRTVDAPVAVRQQGDTVVIPLLDEQLICEKRLVLREELHVTTRRRETHQPTEVSLRREDVVVEPVAEDAENTEK